jgi:hypothetical protein
MNLNESTYRNLSVIAFGIYWGGFLLNYENYISNLLIDQNFLVTLFLGVIGAVVYTLADLILFLLIFIDHFIFISKLNKFIVEARAFLHPLSYDMLGLGTLISFVGYCFIYFLDKMKSKNSKNFP